MDCRPLLTALNTEGSLSDSGISDSGSEQELSDREKRLVQLKRLAKRLESILSPSSQALTNMFKVSTTHRAHSSTRTVTLLPINSQ